MSFKDSDGGDYDPEAELNAIAAEHGVTRDPLAEYEDIYHDKSPFRTWWHTNIASTDLAESTTEKYESHIQHWIDYMNEQGRHPALPAPDHVRDYIEMLRDDLGHSPSTIRGKLGPVIRAFDWFAGETAFNAHKPDANLVRHVRDQMDLATSDSKDFPNLLLEEVREFVDDIDHIRDRLIVALQLKLGLRAGAVANIQLQDLHLGNNLHDHYTELGTHPTLVENGYEQAIHIPADRERTKSVNHRTLPLDGELRQALTRYLLIRPDNGESELILSMQRHAPVKYKSITEVWNKHVKPNYPETDNQRAVTSHFGRHYFSDFWAVEQDLNTHLVQYMRGDAVNTQNADDNSNGLDRYLHPEYDDVEEVYRERIYDLHL